MKTTLKHSLRKKCTNQVACGNDNNNNGYIMEVDFGDYPGENHELYHFQIN